MWSGFSVRKHGRDPKPLMSALGHKQTSQPVCAMSALPPKADIRVGAQFRAQVASQSAPIYSVQGSGIEKILVRHDSLTVARALYKVAALNCSERLIMLCDQARVLARSDRPETMPEIR